MAIADQTQNFGTKKRLSGVNNKNDDRSFFPQKSSDTLFFGPAILQPKLQIGQPDDPYEKEADRIADQVMRMPDAGIQRKCTTCDHEEEVQRKPLIQFKASNFNRSQAAPPDVANKIAATRSLGNPLPKAIQYEMGSKMGADFSGVRVHTDNTAVKLSQELGAKAFTVGNNIYFNQGQYNPTSGEGKRLMTHELVHVTQQKLGSNIHQTNFNGAEQVIQRSFFGDVWSGIKKAGKAVGSAAKWGGKKILKGSRWVGDKIGKTAKWIGGYTWNVLKSAGAWVWDIVTEAPERIWRILKHIGSGIVGTIKWIENSIKRALNHIWKGLVEVFPYLKEGVFGIFSWIWRGLQGGANWGWKLLNGDFSGFWEGIGYFFSWLGDGAVGLVKWGWRGLKGIVVWAGEGAIGVAMWIWQGLKKGAAWVGKFLSKLLDLIGFGEIIDLLFNIIKFNTRELSSFEISEAKKVFGNSINYWQIRIDEYSLISSIGAFFHGGGGMGVTLFHTINFNKKINPSPGNNDMAWLIHELTHVSQYENIGSQYIGEAIYAQSTNGYNYGGGSALLHKDLKDFSREQQGDIIKDYYTNVLYGSSPFAAEYIRIQQQLVNGEFS